MAKNSDVVRERIAYNARLEGDFIKTILEHAKAEGNLVKPTEPFPEPAMGIRPPPNPTKLIHEGARSFIPGPLYADKALIREKTSSHPYRAQSLVKLTRAQKTVLSIIIILSKWFRIPIVWQDRPEWYTHGPGPG